jgi:hypothetical protein
MLVMHTLWDQGLDGLINLQNLYFTFRRLYVNYSYD